MAGNKPMVPRKPYGVLTAARPNEVLTVRRPADTRHEDSQRWIRRDRLVPHTRGESKHDAD